MYHNLFLSGKRAAAVGLAVALTLALGADAARAQSDPIKCRQAVAAASAKYEQARAKALTKCEEAIRKGKLAASSICPNDDQKTLDKISGAQAKLDTAVAKACCGDDKTCGAGSGNDADLALSAIGWNARSLACVGGELNGEACKTATDCPGVCPDGLRQGLGCQPATTNICTVGCRGTCTGGPTPGELCTGTPACGSGGTCVSLVCLGGTNDGNVCTVDANCPGTVTCVAATGCGPATTDVCPNLESQSCNADLVDPSDVAECLSCAGDVATSQVNDFVYGFLNPVDDITEGADKCKSAIAKSTAKYFAALTKGLAKCQKSAIGDSLPAGTCPDADTVAKLVTARQKMLDGIAGKCGGTDDAFGGAADLALEAIGAPLSCANITVPGGAACGTFLNDVADVADCLACISEYKATCNDFLAAPSNGVHPAGCNQNCGNGKIDSGETCDDGNVVDGDSCPSSCNISACTVSGSATANVAFSVPAGANVAGLTIYVDYPEGSVQVPGQGNAVQVSNAITNTPANTTYVPNDLNYALRVVLTENDNAAIGAGTAFDLTLNRCNSQPLPAASTFNCRVESASSPTATNVFGATCTVASVL